MEEDEILESTAAKLHPIQFMGLSVIVGLSLLLLFIGVITGAR